MRTLYNILETILDTDTQITSTTEQRLVPYKLVDLFLEVFPDMYVDYDSHYDRNSDYVAGRVKLDSYDVYDGATTEQLLKTNVRKFANLVRKEFKGSHVETKIKDQGAPGIVLKNHRIIITIDRVVYGLTISMMGSKLQSPTAFKHIKVKEVDFIRVLVGNDELKEAFHNKIK